MTPIFNSNNINKLRISVRATAALRINGEGDAIRMIRRNMALELAEKILQREQFFQVTSETIDRIDFLTYHADVIVLTEREYSDLLQSTFRKGTEHAFGFMPTKDPSVIGY